jgi:AcrR family transcriptional regulator
MPRVSEAHELEVRRRIVRAALQVFAEHGFHQATMQDIVRQSGLSVGAIYTYFKSKDELILAGCDLITDQEMAALYTRLEDGGSFRDKIAIAVGFFFDQLDFERQEAGGPRLLIEAWAAADSTPAIREMLVRRRREVLAVAVALLHEGIAQRELPEWIDIPAVAPALAAMLDGILLESIEEGAGYRRAEAERRVLATLEILFASASATKPEVLQPAKPQTYPSARLESPIGERRAS